MANPVSEITFPVDEMDFLDSLDYLDKSAPEARPTAPRVHCPGHLFFVHPA
jgi:hypothetical protein